MSCSVGAWRGTENHFEFLPSGAFNVTDYLNMETDQ